MSRVWIATVGLLVAASALNVLTDKLQTEGDRILGDRIDLVNSRLDDLECQP